MKLLPILLLVLCGCAKPQSEQKAALYPYFYDLGHVQSSNVQYKRTRVISIDSTGKIIIKNINKPTGSGYGIKEGHTYDSTPYPGRFILDSSQEFLDTASATKPIKKKKLLKDTSFVWVWGEDHSIRDGNSFTLNWGNLRDTTYIDTVLKKTILVYKGKIDSISAKYDSAHSNWSFGKNKPYYGGAICKFPPDTSVYLNDSLQPAILLVSDTANDFYWIHSEQKSMPEQVWQMKGYILMKSRTDTIPAHWESVSSPYLNGTYYNERVLEKIVVNWYVVKPYHGFDADKKPLPGNICIWDYKTIN